MFSDPSIATACVLSLQGLLVTYQLYLLIRSHVWYHLISQVKTKLSVYIVNRQYMWDNVLSERQIILGKVEYFEIELFLALLFSYRVTHKE